jgi:hypothetical protein
MAGDGRNAAKGAQKLISLETRRYSAMLRRILVDYGEGATIRIDGRKFAGDKDVPKLLEEWCTNAGIKQTSNFILERGGRALFGFHGHPSETWAVLTELTFAETLQNEGIARYRILPVRPRLLEGLVERIFRRLRQWFSGADKHE